MGLKLISLVLRNFLSFGNADVTVDLSQTGTTHILGQNLDTNSHNGCGKTTVLNAICFALYDKGITDISKDRFINKTNKAKDTDMMVQLTFTAGGDEYELTRWRGANTDYKLIKNRDYDNPITKAGSNEFNAYIVELIGISYKLFKHTVAFSGSQKSFFEEEAADQRNIIEELLRIAVLSEKAEALKALVKETKKAIEIKEAVINVQKQNVENWHSQVEAAAKRIEDWDTKNAADQANTAAQIEATPAVDYAAQITLFEDINAVNQAKSTSSANLTKLSGQRTIYLNDVKKLTNDKAEGESFIKQHEGFDFDAEKALHEAMTALLNEKNTLDTTAQQLTRDITDLKKEKARVTGELEHLSDNKCPYCSQNFADAKVKISELNNTANEIDLALSQLESEKATLLVQSEAVAKDVADIKAKLVFGNVQTLLTTQTKYQQYVTRLAQIDSDITEKQKAADDLNAAITTAQGEVDEFDAAIATLKADAKFASQSDVVRAQGAFESLKTKLTELKDAKNPHVSVLQELESKGVPTVDSAELDELKVELEHQNFLLKLLTKNDSFIRKKIINRNLSYLNARLMEYTKELGLPHTVVFTPNLDVSISEYDRELDYGNLSGGEQKRLNLSLALAFRDTRQFLQDKINVMFTDEIDGGSMDGSGVEAIIRLIKRKAKDDGIGVWVISHRPEMMNRFDREITVVKEHGFSRIVEGQFHS